MSRRRPRGLIAGAAALVLVAAALTVFVRLEFRPAPHQQARRTPVATSPAATPSPSPNVAGQRLIPGTLMIPKIGVRAVIEQVTVDSHDDMAAPRKPTDVGWYSPGVAPGQKGDAVIDGHLDWYGMPKAVFYYLDQLRRGDQVEVISQTGVQLQFRVTDSTSVASTARPAGLFATSGPARLTLITCAGDWDPAVNQYTQRLLVDATLVGPG